MGLSLKRRQSSLTQRTWRVCFLYNVSILFVTLIVGTAHQMVECLRLILNSDSGLIFATKFATVLVGHAELHSMPNVRKLGSLIRL